MIGLAAQMIENSVMDFVFILEQDIIFWSSKKQVVVARSSGVQSSCKYFHKNKLVNKVNQRNLGCKSQLCGMTT